MGLPAFLHFGANFSKCAERKTKFFTQVRSLDTGFNMNIRLTFCAYHCFL